MQVQELQKLNPALTKEEIKKFLVDLLLPDLRKEIAIFICVSKNEDYFVLDQFYRKHNIQGSDVSKVITAQLQNELKTIGWKTKLVFGGTSIYILQPKETHVSDYFDEILS